MDIYRIDVKTVPIQPESLCQIWQPHPVAVLRWISLDPTATQTTEAFPPVLCLTGVDGVSRLYRSMPDDTSHLVQWSTIPPDSESTTLATFWTRAGRPYLLSISAKGRVSKWSMKVSNTSIWPSSYIIQSPFSADICGFIGSRLAPARHMYFDKIVSRTASLFSPLETPAFKAWNYADRCIETAQAA